MIELFTGDGCPHCITLKNRLDQVGIQYEERNVRQDKAAHAFLVEHGFRSIPQMFRDGVHVTETEVIA